MSFHINQQIQKLSRADTRYLKLSPAVFRYSVFWRDVVFLVEKTCKLAFLITNKNFPRFRNEAKFSQEQREISSSAKLLHHFYMKNGCNHSRTTGNFPLFVLRTDVFFFWGENTPALHAAKKFFWFFLLAVRKWTFPPKISVNCLQCFLFLQI